MRFSKLKIIGILAMVCLAFQLQADDDAEYPAAYYEPVITYQDPARVPSTDEQDQSAVSENTEPEMVAEDTASDSDDRYPAAYFEPVIVFQDSEYIAADKSAAAPKVKPEAKKSPVSDWSDSAGSRATVSDSASFPFMGLLIVLGLFGYVYWTISKDGQSQVHDEVAVSENDDHHAIAGTDELEQEASAEADQVINNEV